MKISKRITASFVASLFFMASGLFVIVYAPPSFAATTPLTMGSSSTYGVLASTAVTSATPSDISGTAGGDVGVGGATPPTGTITRTGSEVLGGASIIALSDANTAFTDVRASTALPVELGGTTLTDGSYSGGTFGMTGTLTLDGQTDPSSVFIFRTTTTLITAAASQVMLINGAQACNVFWQIGSSATLGASSTMVGHLIADVSIDTGATTIVNGQLIALTGAVTLGGTNIVNNSCTHTVTFLGNTSDGGATAAQSANTTTALTTNGFTKTGSTFSGWNTLADHTGTAYANSASYSFAADLTLYAQWTLIPPPIHTVTFLGNTSDGGATAAQSANTATAITTNGFTKTGSIFSGWNTASDGSGTAYANSGSYNFAADLTLYAQWTLIPPPIHTVTFLGNTSNGGSTAAQSANTTTAFTANGFTKTGCTFSEWNTLADNTGTAYSNSASYSFAADLTLYAQWTLIPPPVVPPPPVVSPPTVIPAPPPSPKPIPTVMELATLRIIKLVVNRFGGTAVPSDFAISIRRAGSGVQFKPMQGADGAGALINLAPGTYDLSETPTLGYRGIWSGSITAGGRVLLVANQTSSVTRTNFDKGQSDAREATPTPTALSPSVTKPLKATPPPPQQNPNQTVNGGVLPRTASPWWNLLFSGWLSLAVAVILIAFQSWSSGKTNKGDFVTPNCEQSLK